MSNQGLAGAQEWWRGGLARAWMSHGQEERVLGGLLIAAFRSTL